LELTPNRSFGDISSTRHKSPMRVAATAFVPFSYSVSVESLPPKASPRSFWLIFIFNRCTRIVAETSCQCVDRVGARLSAPQTIIKIQITLPEFMKECNLRSAAGKRAVDDGLNTAQRRSMKNPGQVDLTRSESWVRTTVLTRLFRLNAQRVSTSKTCGDRRAPPANRPGSFF
jgi:hypothetical protein